MAPTTCFRAGAAGMFAAVALGAFGAHALRGRLGPESLSVFETGVRYQAYHSLALLALACWTSGAPAKAASAAGACFVAGIVLFSGSLYALALTGVRGFGAVTPVGGVLFLAGWATLLLGAYR